MQTKAILSILLALLVFSIVSDTFFVVNQQQQALVLQFRESKRIIREPGLNVKIPFIQTVSFFDKRVLPIEPPGVEAILADQKRLVVDAYARYRISDPLVFFQRLNNERRAIDQLGTLVNSSLRQVLGTLTMQDVLSPDRAQIMNDIRDEVNGKAKDYGVEIIDVRIRRADLPSETSQSIFNRMKSEREREAAEFRAKGQEDAQKIKSTAEKERTILLADAQRKAQISRGEGDETALRIMAKATGADPQFFNFYRALMAYRSTLANKDTSLILSPEGDFFQYFGQMKGK